MQAKKRWAFLASGGLRGPGRYSESVRRRFSWVLAAIVLVAAGAVWLRVRHAHVPPNVLLISIDTLRADHLGSYGYAAAQTPALDRLAARGLRFEHAATVTPLTLPAHSSLMTGTFPDYHGVRDNGGFYLGDDQVTLAEVLRGRGYRTGGFVGAFVLDSRWGIGQGFDHYFDDFDLSKYRLDIGMDAVQRPGSEVVDHALAWLDEDSSRPFFAWVHLYEPHAPYDPPETIRRRFPPTEIGAYDGEIATADLQVARLLARLSDEGRLDHTIVVALGDHGESLGEHGEQQHGFFVYDATIRIPLIIAGPGVPAGVIADQVRIVDVMPTVLSLLGIPVPAPVQGQNLLPLAHGQHLNLVALSESWYPRHHFGWSELTAIRDGRFEFIEAPRRELYDTQVDPGEARTLATNSPARADVFERALDDLVARTSSRQAAKAPQAVDPDVEERLRALGYVAGSISPRALEQRPRGDPKDKIGLYNLLKEAGTDSVEGRIDAAIAKVHQALAADPEIVEAHTILGNLYRKAKRQDDAIGAYRQALALDPENQSAALDLAIAYKDGGRLDDAEAGFQRVLQLDPRSTRARWQLADIWMQRGDFARARTALDEALREKVDRPTFLTKLGECDIELKRYDEAERELREALAGKSDESMAHYDLALVAEARHDPARAIAEYQSELTHNPSAYRAHFNLAKLLAESGQRGEALRHLEQAVAVNPEFGTGYLYLAKARLDAGDLDGAEAAARKGLTASPDPDIAPLGHYVLADIYSRLGKPQEAAREASTGRSLEARRAGGTRE